MIENLDRDIQRLLASLDPASAPSAEARPQQRAETLSRILATAPAPTPRRGVTRRTVILAGGAAAVVAGAAVGLGSVLLDSPTTNPAYAATPKLLDDQLLGRGQPAADRLTQLAAAARRSAAAPGNGEYAHLRWQSWSLFTRIDGSQVTSAVIPEIWESWRAPDNSGRLAISYAPPEFPTDEHRRDWQIQGAPGSHSDIEIIDYEPGQFVEMWPEQPPQDPDELREWLAVGHPVENGPAETLVAIADLHREQVLGPAVRAALLEILSELPDMRYAGEVTDRAGRVGSAFFVDSDYSGLPTRYTLIVDSEGRFLGFEEILTSTAGKLGVSIPAVIGYELYLVAEFADLPTR